MSSINVTNIKSRQGSAPTFPQGFVLSGLSTVGVVTGVTSIGASKFYGDLIGDSTGTASTATAAANAYGLTGTPDITIDGVTANDIQGAESNSDPSYLYTDSIREPPVNFATVAPDNELEGIANFFD